jgi:hypothetical protein
MGQANFQNKKRSTLFFRNFIGTEMDRAVLTLIPVTFCPKPLPMSIEVKPCIQSLPAYFSA